MPVSSVFYKQKLSKIGMLPSYPPNHRGLVINEHWYEPSHAWTGRMKPKLVRFSDIKLSLPLITEIRINWNLLSGSQTVWWFRWIGTWGQATHRRWNVATRVRVWSQEQRQFLVVSKRTGISVTIRRLSFYPEKPQVLTLWCQAAAILQNKLSPLPVTAGHCSSLFVEAMASSIISGWMATHVKRSCDILSLH